MREWGVKLSLNVRSKTEESQTCAGSLECTMAALSTLICVRLLISAKVF